MNQELSSQSKNNLLSNSPVTALSQKHEKEAKKKKWKFGRKQPLKLIHQLRQLKCLSKLMPG